MAKRHPVTIDPDSSIREIERKFLILKVPEKLARFPSVLIEQGYLCFEPGHSQVRVRCVYDERFASPEFCLTAKRKSGMVRDEVNVPLTRVKFEQLWQMTEGRRLAKRRYNIPYLKWTIELDVFEGALEGLIMAEVEFPDEGSASAFRPPRWFGREVTKDPAFRNVAMAASGKVPESFFKSPTVGSVS